MIQIPIAILFLSCYHTTSNNEAQEISTITVDSPQSIEISKNTNPVLKAIQELVSKLKNDEIVLDDDTLSYLEKNNIKIPSMVIEDKMGNVSGYRSDQNNDEFLRSLSPSKRDFLAEIEEDLNEEDAEDLELISKNTNDSKKPFKSNCNDNENECLVNAPCSKDCHDNIENQANPAIPSSALTNNSEILNIPTANDLVKSLDYDNKLQQIRDEMKAKINEKIDQIEDIIDYVDTHFIEMLSHKFDLKELEDSMDEKIKFQYSKLIELIRVFSVPSETKKKDDGLLKM